MAKHKQNQVKLVSDSGPAQPPLPGGWALAVCGAIETLSSAFAKSHELGIHRNTKRNINRGDTIKQSTYDDQIEKKLVEILAALFPTTAASTPCLDKFANEFFRLWTFSAEAGSIWVKLQGFTPAQSATLSRALVRDLVLRLSFLECCERELNGESFSEWEIALVAGQSFPHIYRRLIKAKMQDQARTQVGMGLTVNRDSRRLREFMTGEAMPPLAVLDALRPTGECQRLLAGIGFCDSLLRRLRLNKALLAQEVLSAAHMFLPIYHEVLKSFAGCTRQSARSGSVQSEQHTLKGYLACSERILLFPGFEQLIQQRVMPTALWRCHLVSLRFARMMDLAKAYYKFSDEAGDEEFEGILCAAEEEPGASPYRWMENV